MPHYKDGTPAQIGDVVKGKGYNVPHEIIGVLTDIREGLTCNVSVACVASTSSLRMPAYRDLETGQVTPMPQNMTAEAVLEYGQADAFDLIWRRPATT